MENVLKSCPLCGSEAKYHHREWDLFGDNTQKENSNYVECTNCHLILYGDRFWVPGALESIWNHRVVK